MIRPWVIGLLLLWSWKAYAQCFIRDPVDIIWMIDSSSAMLEEHELGLNSFAYVQSFISRFTGLTTMGADSVRQTFVQYAGKIDSSLVDDSPSYESIVSYLNFTDSATSLADSFIDRIAHLSIMGGTRDISGALSFVSDIVATSRDLSSPRKLKVILLASGGPIDALGNEVSTESSERAFLQLRQRFAGQLILIKIGDSRNFPDNFLFATVDYILSAESSRMEPALIDSGFICMLFETDSHEMRGPMITARSLESGPTMCFPIPVGDVCADLSSDIVRLKYTAAPTWKFSDTRSWIGANPTDVPVDLHGSPILSTLPLEGPSVTLNLNVLSSDVDCHVFFLPHATVVPQNSTSSDEELIFKSFAGEVMFNPSSSDARLFRSAIHGCVTGRPTPTPTSPPTISRILDFDLLFLSSFTDSQRLAFSTPIQRLQSIFTNDYATTTCFEPGDNVCGFVLNERRCVDDVLVIVTLKPIDGPGGTLANSGPCVALIELERIRVGQIVLDAEDLDTIIDDGRFNDLVLHSMMHVLGFGSRWDAWNLIRASPPSYIGTNGVNGYRQIGGSSDGFPDLEVDFMHWKESVFETELMTPDIQTAANPLSYMTILSLKDMGFQVDESRGDAYDITPSSRRLATNFPRLLQQSVSGDVIVGPVQSANWTVKPGRESDLQTELDFARANFKTKTPTSPSSTTDAALAGAIVGAVLGAIILLFVIIFLYRRCYQRAKRDKQDKALKKQIPSKEKKSGPKDEKHANWSEKTDPDGRVYWVNEETGEFSWTPPEAFNRAPEREPSNVTSQSAASSFRRAVGTPAGDKWSEMTDDTGKTYWINEESGEFSWVAPVGYSSSKSFAPSQKDVESPIPNARASSTALSPSPVRDLAPIADIDVESNTLEPVQPGSSRAYDVDSTDHEAQVSLLHEEELIQPLEIENVVEESDIDYHNTDPEASISLALDDSHLTESMPHYSLRSRGADSSHLTDESMPNYSLRSRGDDLL